MNKKIKYFLTGIFFLCSLSIFAQQNKTDSLRTLLKKLNGIHSLEFRPTIKGEGAGEAIDTIHINTLNELAWVLGQTNPDTAIILCNQALNLSMTLLNTEDVHSPLRKTRETLIGQTYQNLGISYSRKGDYTLSLDYYFKALKTRELLNDKSGVASTLGNMGNVCKVQGNYSKALDYYFKAINESEDKNGIARHLTNIGSVYLAQADYPKALDYYFKALKMIEELKDKNGISTILINIGGVFLAQSDYPKALDYYFKALKLDEELGDKQGTAILLGNMGLIYYQQASEAKTEQEISGKAALFKKALDYYFKALKIEEELKDKDITASFLCNVGVVYYDQANEEKSRKKFVTADSLFHKALYYDLKTLKLMEELGSKNGIAACSGNVGTVYTSLGKYKEAEEYLQRALKLSTEINSLSIIKDEHQYLSELYQQMHQQDKALYHYKKYIQAKDSIFNEDNTRKTVRSEMNFEFEKKQAIEKAEQEKQNVITQQEKQKQKIILTLVSCFLLIVAIFASFMFNRWRITQKQKLIIEKQKEKIVDSITYAQLIQQSILLEESEIRKILPECFIYFQPKDIVSGDFYWCSVINDKIILAAVDCTGHGVPGAFMSMIGNTLLNQIVNEKQITTPSEILRLLNLEVIESLHQHKDGALSKDGMAIALCSIDYKNSTLEYAGAQNPLYIVTDNDITVVNADGYGIGSNELRNKKKNSSTADYTNHIISIKKDMSIFLFSDGYTDQFGGEKRKKFGTKKFRELLLNNQQLSMQKQKELIIKAHQDWKGSTTQIDDILVIGIKL